MAIKIQLYHDSTKQITIEQFNNVAIEQFFILLQLQKPENNYTLDER